uniref:Uncharacterized protein n=1 Tax=Arundo donax TaxID=35708 RepID=A0A0A9DJ89_ARUDO
MVKKRHSSISQETMKLIRCYNDLMRQSTSYVNCITKSLLKHHCQSATIK